MATRAIDGWVNVSMGEVGRPDFLTRVATDTFKQGDDFFRNYSIDEMLEVMDEIGVEKAILTTELTRPSEHVLSFTDAHPDRFAIGDIDPADYEVFVVKSRAHFRRGFDETGFAKTIIIVEATGPFIGTTFLDALPYENVDLSSLYPYGTPDGR